MRRRSTVGIGAAVLIAVPLGITSASGCIGGVDGSAAERLTPARDAAADVVRSANDGATSSFDSTTGDANVEDAGPADSATGDANIDAGPPWKLYSNSTMTASTTWNAVALDVAWSGPNAPPPRGIKAVTQLNDFPRLLVWADNGMFYVRDTAGWRPPVATATLFPALAGRDFGACGHQPSTPGTAPADRVENLVFTDNPTAILYTYSALDAAQYALTVTMTDETGPYGAPKGTKKTRWVLRIWDPSKYGTAGYLADYSGFDNDPNVFFYDATPAPTNKWLFADAPLFVNKTNVPPQQNIRAAYRDDALGINYLVVR